jgi:NhaP-type Na+/H+ or K+/H+ antiporter
MSFWLFLVGGLLVFYAVVSRRLSTTIITGPMFFVTAGLILGPELVGFLEFERSPEDVSLLFEATLALVLFSDASAINSTNWRSQTSIPGRLLGWGLPLTMAAGLAVALVLFGALDFWEAALIAVILAPTDAALGQAVISNPRVPERIRNSLNIESGLNDGLALPILLVVLSAAEEAAFGGTVGSVVTLLAQEILVAVGVGIAVGWIGATALVRSSARHWISGIWLQIAAVALAGVSFGLADPLGGSGFIAVWITGLVVGLVARDHLDPTLHPVNEFAENLGTMMTMVSFLVFGAVLLAPSLRNLSWEIGLYAALSLSVVRMIPVALALVGAKLQPATVLYLGWFGPRGLASIIFAGIVATEAVLPGGPLITTVVMITVGTSVYAHGATSVFGSGRYADWYERQEDIGMDMHEAKPMPDVRTPKRFQAPGMGEVE